MSLVAYWLTGLSPFLLSEGKIFTNTPYPNGGCARRFRISALIHSLNLP